MDRRAFVGGMTGGGLSIVTPCLRAQPAGRRAVVGILSAGTPEPGAPNRKAFNEALAQLGYAEGRNVVIERRYAGGNPETLTALAAELVRLQPDVIVAASNSETDAVKRATTTIPIVMAVCADPVGAGFVASLAHPGGNITGLSTVAGTEIRGKRLGLLKEIVPGLSRVAVLRTVGETTADLTATIERTATILGLTLAVVDIRRPEDFERGYDLILQTRPEALFLDGASLLFSKMHSICDFALRNRLPGTSANREFAAAGFLITYGLSLVDNWRRTAFYVDKILRGAQPAALPGEQPTKFEMVINLKTARALGLTIPQSLLLRVDEVIE